MKLPLAIPLLSLVLLSSGCITPYLDVQSHEDKVAALFDVDPNQFRFLDYCLYKENPNPGWDDPNPFKGIVGITETDFYLVYGDINTASSNEVRKIPISNIDGVSQTPKEVQIQYGSDLVVVVFYQSLSMKPNPKKSWNLYETITAMDVPEFDAYWTFSAIGDRIRSGEDNGGPGIMDSGTIPLPVPQSERFPISFPPPEDRK